MSKQQHPASTIGRYVLLLTGCIILPAIWIIVKYVLQVSDRYLPDPIAVLEAMGTLKPSIFAHAGITLLRVVIGLVAGVACGVGFGLLLWRNKPLRHLIEPSLHGIRAVPAIATIPFFLVWFGFSDTGRIILVLGAVGVNVTVAALTILARIDDRFVVSFASFGSQPESHIWDFALPFVLRSLLPTVRFALALTVTTIVAAELLGAQTGLGYLIQTSRSTFALHTILLASIFLGLITALLDWCIRILWHVGGILFWR